MKFTLILTGLALAAVTPWGLLVSFIGFALFMGEA